uniref:Uncharacterized protein n=1 Tax=Arundo donax TaxID=35708 RepID=A0A0A9A3Q6_ARUDO
MRTEDGDRRAPAPATAGRDVAEKREAIDDDAIADYYKL